MAVGWEAGNDMAMYGTIAGKDMYGKICTGQSQVRIYFILLRLTHSTPKILAETRLEKHIFPGQRTRYGTMVGQRSSFILET